MKQPLKNMKNSFQMISLFMLHAWLMSDESFFNAVKCGQGYKPKILKKLWLYIQKIYFLENRLREQNLSEDEFVAQRKLKILPVLNEFHDWMVQSNPK
ncbi:hypothetical protein [Treponema bryantii]|uniref:hypothetical protein n=1 Tax=Treponema bryantii TaxID=163 RepID=UPI0030C89866